MSVSDFANLAQRLSGVESYADLRSVVASSFRGEEVDSIMIQSGLDARISESLDSGIYQGGWDSLKTELLEVIRERS